MRILRTGLLIAVVLAGLARTSPVAQEAGTEESVKPLDLPVLVADDADRIEIDEHDEGALLTVSGPAFDSLWYLRGDRVEAVKFDGGDRVLGDQVYVQLGGNPAIVEYRLGGQLDDQYLLVENGEARDLKHASGERFNPPAVYAFRESGVVVFAVATGRGLERFFVLKDGVVHPLLTPKDEPLEARMIVLTSCPDGRTHVVAWRGSSEFVEYFLEGSRLNPVPPPKLPGEDWTATSNLFVAAGRAVIASHADDNVSRAAFTGDEPRWIRTGDGEPLSHEHLVGRVVDGRLFLFGADKPEGKGASESFIYRVQDGVARASAATDIELRNVHPHVVGDRLFAANQRAEGVFELLSVADDRVERMHTGESEFVTAPGEIRIVRAGDRILVNYSADGSTRWGELDESTLHPLGAERTWYAPEFGDWAWELDGELYLRWEEVADGQQYQWFGRVDKRNRLVPLATEDGPLRGATVTAQKQGGRLLLALRALDGGARLFSVR